jgi:cellulose synthase operon protein B
VLHAPRGRVWLLVQAALWATLLALLPPAPSQASPLRQVSLVQSVRSFRDYGYGDQTARAMFQSFDFLLPVPRGQAPRDGTQLELVISHSPLVVPDRSTMTVVVNGQNIHSALLTLENRDHGRLVVPLPIDSFSGPGYQVQIQFYLRLTRDECEEAQNPALWATVHGDSLYQLVTGPANGPGLEEIDGLLTPVGGPPPPVRFVLSSDPHPLELEAAGIAAFQVGRWSAAVRQDPLIDLDSNVAQFGPSIVVGGANLAASLGQPLPTGLGTDGTGFLAGGTQIPAEQGLLAVSRSPATWVLLSGTSPAGVREAAEALGRPARRAALRGDYTIVGRATTPASASLTWSEGAASFAQLGLGARQLVGAGDHVLDLTFDRPPAWVLKNGTSLELAFETSPAIRTETSWIAVIVNGREAGTRQILPAQGTSRTYRFELTPELLNADLDGRPLRELALQLRVHLEIPQGGCTQTLPSSAWATLLPTSAWRLPHDPLRSLDLGRFPGQLLGQDVDSPLLVVLPEFPTREEMMAGLQTLAAIGRWSAEDVAQLPRLVYAHTVTEQERQRSNVIVVSGPDRNAISLLASRQDASWFTPYTPPAYRQPSGELRGNLRLVPSPWSRDRMLLVMTGSEPDALSLASSGLTRRSLLLGLRGSVASIVEQMAPQGVEITSAGAAPLRLDPRVETPPVEPPTAPRVLAAILLVALGLCAVVVIHARTAVPPSEPA